MANQRLPITPCPNCGHNLAVAPGPLTPTQLDCARVIHELTEARGYAPSYAEIGFELGIKHRSGVKGLIDQLEERGWLVRTPRAYRSIRLLVVPPAVDTDIEFVLSAETAPAALLGELPA